MLERNKGKLNVAVIFLIIAIIVIGVMGAYIYLEKDKSDQKIGELENKIQNIEKVVQDKSKEEELAKKEEKKKENIILYLGMNFANAEPGTYSGDGIENEKYPDFYNTTYDMYRNGKNVGKTKGEVTKTTGIDHGGYAISFEKSDYEEAKNIIFVSCNYNVVPREYTEVEDIPEEIENDFADCESVKVQSIDLDGDNTIEYIVSFIKTGEYSKMSGIVLYDSNYNSISKLATIDDIYLGNFEKVTYIDVDNDGIMEILMDIPVGASFFRTGLYKYNNGQVEGEIEDFSVSP